MLYSPSIFKEVCMKKIFFIFLFCFFAQAEDALLEQAQRAIYQIKTPSSKGVAFAISDHLLVTTFYNILNVSDLNEIIVSNENSSKIEVKKVTAVSFYRDLAVLEVKEKLNSFLKGSRAFSYHPFHILGFHKEKSFSVRANHIPLKMKGFNNFYRIYFSRSNKEISLNGAPIINKQGRFVGVVYQNKKSEAHFVSSNLLNSLLRRKQDNKSNTDIIQIEKENLIKHMKKNNANSKLKIFHLKNILESFFSNKKTNKIVRDYLQTGVSSEDTYALLNFGVFSLLGREGFNSWYVDWIETAAKQGHVEAQFILGMIYYRGAYSNDWSLEIDIHKDYNKAANWLKRAAEKGHEEAQFYTGELYDKGYGVPQSSKAAFRFFYRSAKQDHAEAQWRVAISYGDKKYYDDEDMTDKERKSAKIYWLKEAAKQGHVEAQFKLGEFYLLSEQSKKKSMKWLKKAAKQGHMEAQFILGVILFTDNKFEISYHWFEKAAKQGHVDAKKMAGLCAESFKNMEKNK